MFRFESRNAPRGSLGTSGAVRLAIDRSRLRTRGFPLPPKEVKEAEGIERDYFRDRDEIGRRDEWCSRVIFRGYLGSEAQRAETKSGRLFLDEQRKFQRNRLHRLHDAALIVTWGRPNLTRISNFGQSSSHPVHPVIQNGPVPVIIVNQCDQNRRSTIIMRSEWSARTRTRVATIERRYS